MDRTNESAPGPEPNHLKPLTLPPGDTFAAWMAAALQVLLVPATVVYRNLPLSEDAICAAFGKALTVWTRDSGYFASAAHLLNWLKQTAYWETINRFRQGVRCREESIADYKVETVIDVRSNPQRTQRWSTEDQNAVWVCVQQLPPLDRYLIEGRYYDRLTDRDLAKVVFGTPSPSRAQGLRMWHRRQQAEMLLRRLLVQHGVTAT